MAPRVKFNFASAVMLSFLVVLLASSPSYAQMDDHAGHDHSGHNHADEGNQTSHSSDMGHMGNMGGGSNSTNITSSVPCIANPQNASCANYVYPTANITADLTDLCTQMSFMPGCSVKTMCEQASLNKSDVATKPYCQPFSVLANVCAKDMPRMRGCRNYSAMCAQNSTVAQCTQSPAIANIPTTNVARDQVRSICTSMPKMAGCEKCVFRDANSYPECDLLGVYSTLCLDMPDMAECAGWKTMCSGAEGLPFCSSQLNKNATSQPTSGSSNGFTFQKEMGLVAVFVATLLL
ncbi:hypothetical protein HK102_009772 [Quaeritorhiza haematococci]|nr:hypothetical protein HK102_009772 [Quaeritorhiza haematococci]